MDADRLLLDADERDREAAYRNEDARRRFTIGAGLLHRMLAEVWNEPATTKVVERECDRCGEPHGRPQPTRNGWHCSVTHSHQLVGVAISNRGPIGLDVEHVRDITVDDMRGALTHSELAHVRRQHPDDRVGEVFRSWVRKESIVKLTGEGVAAMPAYEVTTRSDNGFWTVQDASQGDTNYVVRDLPAHTGYVAAIAEYTPME